MSKTNRRAVSRSALLGERVHGDVRGDRHGAYDEVYRLVRRVPRGRVVTYGQVATLIENRLSARAVGWALHGCPAGVPWQRVVNASGGCSTDRLPDVPDGLQRAMLESEGIEFGEDGRLDLERYRWNPSTSRRGSGGKATKRPSR
jgi:methylated-DNA-protein-cysteine methyltransferase-like protein